MSLKFQCTSVGECMFFKALLPIVLRFSTNGINVNEISIVLQKRSLSITLHAAISLGFRLCSGKP